MSRFYKDIAESGIGKVNVTALLLLCIVLCISTGFVTQYLEVLEVECLELNENSENKGETDSKEGKEKIEKETDDFTHYNHSYSLWCQSLNPYLTISHYDWHIVYVDIFVPPPECH